MPIVVAVRLQDMNLDGFCPALVRLRHFHDPVHEVKKLQDQRRIHESKADRCLLIFESQTMYLVLH